MEYFVIGAKFVLLKYYTLSSQLQRLTSFSVGYSGRRILSPGQIAVMRKWSIVAIFWLFLTLGRHDIGTSWCHSGGIIEHFDPHCGSKYVNLPVDLLSISLKVSVSPKMPLTTFLHAHHNVRYFRTTALRLAVCFEPSHFTFQFFCCFLLSDMFWHKNKLMPLWYHWAFWNMGIENDPIGL